MCSRVPAPCESLPIQGKEIRFIARHWVGHPRLPAGGRSGVHSEAASAHQDDAQDDYAETQLLEHLASVRERGVAFDLEENLTGVVCVAAPIFDHLGRVVASLSVSGPASRMESKLLQIQDEVRNAGEVISRTLSPQSAPRMSSQSLQSFPASPAGQDTTLQPTAHIPDK